VLHSGTLIERHTETKRKRGYVRRKKDRKKFESDRIKEIQM
jgi:hypothetical protein